MLSHGRVGLVDESLHAAQDAADRSAQDAAERFMHGSSELGTLGQSRNAVSVAPEVAEGPADDVPVVDSQREQVKNAPGCVTPVTYVRFGHTMLN